MKKTDFDEDFNSGDFSKIFDDTEDLKIEDRGKKENFVLFFLIIPKKKKTKISDLN